VAVDVVSFDVSSKESSSTEQEGGQDVDQVCCWGWLGGWG